VLAEGRLVLGRKGLAGEFGHICVDPAGPLCGCGHYGCWEMFASSRAAIRYYQELVPNAQGIAMNELIRLAVNGDAAAQSAIERQSIAIGRGLRTINAALSPDVILFAGDITIYWDMVKDIIGRECADGLLTKSAPLLVSSGDGELALLRGAAAVVLQRHSGYYRASHSNQKSDRNPRQTAVKKVAPAKRARR
jgi:predicted NBD/HSP70 family sugar kinase